MFRLQTLVKMPPVQWWSVLCVTCVAVGVTLCRGDASSVPPTPLPCTGGYNFQFGEWCYAYISEGKDWASAESVCKAIGGYLAEVHNKQENDFLAKIRAAHPGKMMWLGAHDLITEGQWFWATSGLSLKATEFTDWNRGEPNNGGKGNGAENCLEFHPAGHWNDRPCDNVAPFVCQKPIDRIVVG